jgi:hypothetical protein
MGKLGDSLREYVLYGDFDGEGDFLTGDVVSVPPCFIDGVHARQMMGNEEFPLKIQVISTGKIYSVHGFFKNGAVYTSETFRDGLSYSERGLYFGEFGKDFLYI